MIRRIFLGLLLLTFSAQAQFVSLIDGPYKNYQEVEVFREGNDLIMSFHLSKLYQDPKLKTGRFQGIKFKTLKLTNKVGAPALPFHSIILKGTPNQFHVDFKANKAKTIPNLIPAPTPRRQRRCSAFVPIVNRMRASEALYQADEKRPSYRVEYLGDFNGTPISRLTVTPSYYDYTANQFIIYPQLEVRVTQRSGKKVRGFKTMDQVLQNINYQNFKKNLLIITPERFAQALIPFTRWKKKMGYKVNVVSMEAMGATRDQIRASLHARFQNPKTRYNYALLVGEEKVFPTFYLRTSSSVKTPSDLPYFTMGGRGDFIPEVLYGRMVVNTEADIINQTKKIIKYEKANFRDFNGFANGFVIGSNEGENPSDAEYVMGIADDFKKHVNARFVGLLQGKGTATTPNITAQFNRGAMWVTYMGHGSGHDWSSTNDYYSTADIPNSFSKPVKPVVIDVACQNGRFTKGKFGETFMNATSNGRPTGAVAYYGGSVNISWHPPAIMATGIERMRHAKNLERLGEMLLAGQMYLYERVSEISEVRENFVWYHLFGDPTLMVRNKIPKKVYMTRHNDSLIFKYANGSFKNRIVVFHDNKERYVRVKTNAVGQVKIPPADLGYTHYSFARPGFVYMEGLLYE